MEKRQRGLTNFCGIISMLAAISAGAVQASAQSAPRTSQDRTDALYSDPARGETVRERPRPGYDPIGIRLGSFFLYPELGVEEYYRDNIFYADTDETSDFVTVVEPRARLQSNWNNHALTLSAGVESGWYLDNSSEDYVDADFGVDGRIDVRRNLILTGGIDVSREHEDRRSVDQVGADEPVTYNRYRGTAGALHRFNRLFVGVDGSLEKLRYDNVDAAGGGVFRADDRDRRIAEMSIRSGYSLSPRFEPFGRIEVNDRRYDEAIDSNGFERDSHGWEASIGTAFDLTGITFGEVYVGYLTQYYDGAQFDTISGLGFGGSLVWNPTGLTTVTAEAERSVEETTLANASGALRSALAVSVDHELRRNVILFGTISGSVTDYQDIDREDRYGSIGFGGSYLANEFLKFDLSYSNARRDSTTDTSDFATQTIRFRLTAQM